MKINRNTFSPFSKPMSIMLFALLIPFLNFSQVKKTVPDSTLINATERYQFSLRNADTLSAALSLKQISEYWSEKKNYRNAAVNAEKALLLLSLKKDQNELKKGLHFFLYDVYKKAHYAPKQLYHLEKYLALNDSLNKTIDEAESSTINFEREKKHIIDSLNRSSEQKLNDARHLSEAETKQQKNVLRYFIAGALLLLVILGALLIKRTSLQKKQVSVTDNLGKDLDSKEMVETRRSASKVLQALFGSEKIFSSHFQEFFILGKNAGEAGGVFYQIAEIKKLREGKMVFEKGQSASPTSNSLFLSVGFSNRPGLAGTNRSILALSILKEAVQEKKMISPDKVVDYVQSNYRQIFDETDDELKLISAVVDKEKMELSWAGNNNILWVFRNGKIHKLQSEPKSLNKFSLVPGDVLFSVADQEGLYAGEIQLQLEKYSERSLEEHRIAIEKLTLNPANEELLCDDILIIASKI